MAESIKSNPAESRVIPINVDIRRALKVLSRNVFSGQETCIRELVANSVDAISRLPQEQMGGVEIRITPYESEGLLCVQDNGAGLTKEEAIRYLGTLFSSSSENRDEAVGQFGVGFYSCIPLCERVEVLTRSENDAPEAGTCILFSGEQNMSVSTVYVERRGVLVKLFLLEESADLLRESRLLEIIQRDCKFVPYPIYLGDSWELLNHYEPAPWYLKSPTEHDLHNGLKEHFSVENALCVIRLGFKIGSGMARGVVYVNEPGKAARISLFSKRIFVTASEAGALSDYLKDWVSVVVDVDDLPLVLSRDAVLQDSAQIHALRSSLEKCLVEGLQQMANTQEADFRAMNISLGTKMKLACVESEIFRDALLPCLLFRSSLRRAVTIPDYLAGCGKKEIIFIDNVNVGAGLLPLYDAINREVLYMTDTVDIGIRSLYEEIDSDIQFKRIDEDPPQGDDADAQGNGETAKKSWVDNAVVELFRSTIDERLKVETRMLGSQSPVAVLSITEKARHFMDMTEHIQDCKKEGRLEELPSELREIADSGFIDFLSLMAEQRLILNRSHSLGAAFLDKIRTGGESTQAAGLLEKLARFIHAQALLSSGIKLSSERLSSISQIQTDLITHLLKTN